MKLTQLITNADGRTSTTGFIQVFSWIVLTAAFLYGVWADKSYVSDWFWYYAAVCVFGSPASKGVVTMLKERTTKQGDAE
ncbi:DUF2644 domain-containing protein [Pasteurellaceae bacterium HPA106]|uniref:DUF2644 domain-containing protein n=1 Tax=Spirabiliibacterium pneumoniae TaxID=221400 RepID=UPI001AAC64FD|nr:DUF2644 domain-containing protein [Spirabiliibacterium pneumoniae]MBE2895471.1 DUF2644 domain-containing protein [Spirabiliibacterium pneumoniae]